MLLDEENVRFYSFRILTYVSNNYGQVLSDLLPELLKKLDDIFTRAKLKRDSIVQEKGRKYQCMEMLIALVAFAKNDKAHYQNQELLKLNEDIQADEEWSKIYDSCTFESSEITKE